MTLVVAAGLAGASAGPFDAYVAGSTLVIKDSGSSPLIDEGAVVCVKSGPEPSLGGGCVAFGLWDSIEVLDKANNHDVAFQVCLDNDGDSICGFTGNQTSDVCADDLFFSHDDNGNFFNPLGPLPTSFRFGCPGGPWAGYVVFLCEGVHNATLPHSHLATQGTIKGTWGGTGFGDFCFPPLNAPPKEYKVV